MGEIIDPDVIYEWPNAFELGRRGLVRTWLDVSGFGRDCTRKTNSVHGGVLVEGGETQDRVNPWRRISAAMSEQHSNSGTAHYVA